MKNFKFIFQAIIIFSLTLMFHSISLSQNQIKIDSLENTLKSATEDSNKVKILTGLGFEFARIDPEKSFSYAQNALDLSEKLNYKNGSRVAMHCIGIYYVGQSKYHEAISYYNKVIQISEELGNKNSIASAYNNIGNAYVEMGKYDSSITFYFNAVNIYNKLIKENPNNLSNKHGLANTYGNIGNIYIRLENFIKALEYSQIGLKLKEDLLENKFDTVSTLISIGGLYGNIGIIYEELNPDSALIYHFKSLNVRERINDQKGIANSYGAIAEMYRKRKNYTEAIKYFYKAIEINSRINKQYSIAQDYNNLGNLYIEQGDFDNAINAINKSNELALKINSKPILIENYLNLSKIHDKKGDYKLAYNYHLLFSNYKDSSINDESNKQIAEMQTKYETEKKEKEIELQKAQIEIKDSENKKQQYIIWSVASGFLLMIFFSGLIFRKNKEIVKSKKEVEKAKKKIEEHQKEIIDSITYARRLQHAILPPTELIKKYFPNTFVLYKPKDIVAGDFYWMEFIDNIVFIAAADCTGHGVPGAMVSVVCSNALNRAVKEFGLRDTGKILDKVTDLVLETFEKSASEVKDGMDISLLAYNMTSKQIQWSGANNPLWYIHNGQIVEIKADKQPVGKFDKRKSFTTHSIEHSHNSVFYLFTDGLPDQFGGPKGKKFMYKRFENNLTDISKLPMDEQQAVLEKSFQDWKGSLEQVDDVTVIGIKI